MSSNFAPRKSAFKRPDAGTLTVAALDANGDEARTLGGASKIELLPEVIYYLITGR